MLAFNYHLAFASQVELVINIMDANKTKCGRQIKLSMCRQGHSSVKLLTMKISLRENQTKNICLGDTKIKMKTNIFIGCTTQSLPNHKKKIFWGEDFCFFFNELSAVELTIARVEATIHINLRFALIIIIMIFLIYADWIRVQYVHLYAMATAMPKVLAHASFRLHFDFIPHVSHFWSKCIAAESHHQ